MKFSLKPFAEGGFKSLIKYALRSSKRNRYFSLLVVMIQKLPFFNYLSRSFIYILFPSLQNKRAKELFKYSLFDVFNSLVVVNIIVIALAYTEEYKSFNIIKALNPAYVLWYWMITSLYYSIVFAIMATSVKIFLYKISRVRVTLKVVSDAFYKTMCHTLRFLALLAPILGIYFIAGIGEALTHGERVGHSIVGFLSLMVTGPIFLFIFPYTLFAKPVSSFIFNTGEGKHDIFLTLLVLLMATTSLNISAWKPTMTSHEWINFKIICKELANGNLGGDPNNPVAKDFTIKYCAK